MTQAHNILYMFGNRMIIFSVFDNSSKMIAVATDTTNFVM